MTLSLELMFIIWMVGPVLVCLTSLKAIRLLRRKHPRRAPFTQKLERTPGGTLLSRIEELSEEITIQTLSLVTLPIVLYAGYITHLYTSGRRVDFFGAGLLVMASLATVGYFLYSILKLIALRRSLRLGYIGELTVGQSLNRMMLKGWRVYHDFPAEGFNIDHIVVGDRGIFAIETKTRSKPVSADRRADATVTYDGRMLHFPTGSDHEMIDQAKRQSKWLARWLSHAVGEHLTVRAIIVLPGWFVKRTSPEGLPVVNPKQFDSLFAHIQPRSISAPTMARIFHQLDQRCGDITTESKLDGNL